MVHATRAALLLQFHKGADCAGSGARRCRVDMIRLLGTVLTLAVVAAGCGGRAADDATGATAAYFETIRDDPVMLGQFLDRMPLGGDLHHHMAGGVRPAALIRLAAADGLCLPAAQESVWILRAPPCTGDMRPVAAALNDDAFHREIERRWSMQNYLSDDASIDRDQANDYFFTTFEQSGLALRDFGRVLAAARTLAARQGVVYLETSTGYTPVPEARARLIASVGWNDDLAELRETILAHPDFGEIRDRTVDALSRELARSDQILGCSGERPDAGCDALVRFQQLFVRTVDPTSFFVRLLLAYEIAQASPIVVGINLAGPETHPVSLRDYELHMKMFGEMGVFYPEVGRTLHAGEMTDERASALGAERHIALAVAPAEGGGAAAQRIGHAVALSADPDPARLMAQMRQRGVAVEINLESNRQLLGVGPVGHPFLEFLSAGVPVALCTDDPGPMLSDLQQQFALAARNDEVSYPTLKTLALNSITYSFLSASDKQRLLDRLGERFREFEATPWVSG